MIRKYKCSWCDYEFEQDVRTSIGDKKDRVSSHVKCPNCMRLIETYPKEYTGNLIGRRHIHRK